MPQGGVPRAVSLTRENPAVLRRRLRSPLLSTRAIAGAALLAPAGGIAHARTTKSCLVPGVGKPLDHFWRPRMLAAIGYPDTRTGDVAFAVRTEDRLYGYRP